MILAELLELNGGELPRLAGGASGYGSIELGQPGNPECPNEYNEASTLICPGAVKCLIQISVAAVYIEFGINRQGATGVGNITWGPKEPLLPIVLLRGRRFDAIRVRNYTKGVPAQVLITPQAAGT